MDKGSIAVEVAGSVRGIDIDSLGNMAAAAEDVGKARREHYVQVGHCEVVWLAEPGVI